MSDIKELRGLTSAPIAAVKSALEATKGDKEAAIALLRAQGRAASTSKARSDRVAAEGLVAAQVTADGSRGCLVELRSETDFVARNHLFRNALRTTASNVLGAGPSYERAADESMIAEIAGTLGEKVELGRIVVHETSGTSGAGAHQRLQPYLHGALEGGLGRIGVLLNLSASTSDALERLAKPLAMHVAAMNPTFLSAPDDDVADRQAQAIKEAMKDEKKPEHILEAIVQGKLRKWREEVCLLEQAFVGASDDSGLQVAKLLGSHQMQVHEFTRIAI